MTATAGVDTKPQPAGNLATPRSPDGAVDGWRWTLRIAAIAALFGAEAIHVAVMNAHFHEWVAAGIFFLAISVIEGLLAAALIVLPSRRLCLIAATVSLATVAVWAVSRGTGLPFGPAAGVPEATGLADSASTLFELASAACLVMSCNLTVAPGKAWRVRATIAVVAATALLTGGAIRASGGAHHHAGHSLAGSVSGLPTSARQPAHVADS